MASQFDQKFGPTRRLHFNWQYRRFFDQSEVFRIREATIYRIPNHLPHYRLGITLKARGTSVERNRVKRKIREFFRIHADSLGSFDYNVVIPASKKLAHPYPKRLKASLERTFLHAILGYSSS